MSVSMGMVENYHTAHVDDISWISEWWHPLWHLAASAMTEGAFGVSLIIDRS